MRRNNFTEKLNKPLTYIQLCYFVTAAYFQGDTEIQICVSNCVIYSTDSTYMRECSSWYKTDKESDSEA